MLLTVEYDDKGVIEIYCDKEGLNLLSSTLEKLRERGGHQHLMTSSWSGWELSEDKQNPKNELINHLCIILRPAE